MIDDVHSGRGKQLRCQLRWCAFRSWKRTDMVCHSKGPPLREATIPKGRQSGPNPSPSPNPSMRVLVGIMRREPRGMGIGGPSEWRADIVHSGPGKELR